MPSGSDAACKSESENEESKMLVGVKLKSDETDTNDTGSDQ